MEGERRGGEERKEGKGREGKGGKVREGEGGREEKKNEMTAVIFSDPYNWLKGIKDQRQLRGLEP